MKVAFFNIDKVQVEFLLKENEKYNYDLKFYEEKLTENTTSLTKGYDVICISNENYLSKKTLELLEKRGINKISIMATGYDNIDLPSAIKNHIRITNVPRYSCYAIAEHAVGLILSLNRKIHKAYSNTRNGDFSIKDFMGFDLNGKTVGIIGTGYIGSQTARILNGFGCRLLGYDEKPNTQLTEEVSIQYTDLKDLLSQSDIITLHCPLTKETKYLINKKTIGYMKKGVMLINTSRGAVIDTKAVIEALKEEKIGLLGIDTYENENNLFLRDLSNEIIEDDMLIRLLNFPNVLITSHQAFFTKEAIEAIFAITFENITQLYKNIDCPNEITKKPSV